MRKLNCKTNIVYYHTNNVVMIEKELTMKTKLYPCKTTTELTLSYSSELWMMADKLRLRITVCKVKSLRRLVGNTWRDRKWNRNLREKLEAIQNIDEMETAAVGWTSNANRIRGHNRKLFNLELNGRIPRSRSKMQWEEVWQIAECRTSSDWAKWQEKGTCSEDVQLTPIPRISGNKKKQTNNNSYRLKWSANTT